MPEKIINAAITIELRKRFIRAEKEPASTSTYLGKFNFLIKSPRLTIEAILPVVTSAKKFHKTIPISR